MMRHLITLFFLVAAGCVYATGIGPLFFGTPWLGALLVAMGLVLEATFWRRAMAPAKRPRRRY